MDSFDSDTSFVYRSLSSEHKLHLDEKLSNHSCRVMMTPMRMLTITPTLIPAEDPELPACVPATIDPLAAVEVPTVADARLDDESALWMLLWSVAVFCRSLCTVDWLLAASPTSVTVLLTWTPLRRAVVVVSVIATRFVLTPAVVATPFLKAASLAVV